MRDENNFAEIGMRSLNRVTAKVYERALKANTPLPIWRNGEVEYILPSQVQIDELNKKCGQHG